MRRFWQKRKVNQETTISLENSTLQFHVGIFVKAQDADTALALFKKVRDGEK
ncbi:hypothetical protein MUP79_06365 [Candidatus Bathyarchaeota archaeon]|nr:hypothetical protein [Candidatus Bathyarchaeota archaeon]